MARRSPKPHWMLIGMISGALVAQLVLPSIAGSAFDPISWPYAFLIAGAFVGANIGSAVDVVGNRPDDKPHLG